MQPGELEINGLSSICNRIPRETSSAGIPGWGEKIPSVSRHQPEVDYDQGLWSVSLPFLDAVGISSDFQEARQGLFEYIDLLWNEYVLCSEEDLGETGRMHRNLLLELFSVS